ncbi:sensor histidine kinase [Cellulomonas shaoxiangyii]|uniref:histidine kinase n=1 Tax=Cellulomonas shaoxiangyii TaxID=2566013 RepID=A0A4P7SFR8_9CELL|nr:histidine kinase [Cellulomonas shaoxiangyii]QCB92750.1 two-component sensor histidine kinase [Cellulomonas shaoxiangyii]TGY81516.1 two-component sensor histidine kinase [Cellulomonas shaoxiangyii]
MTAGGDVGGHPVGPDVAEAAVPRPGPVRRFLLRRPGLVDAAVVTVFTGWALLLGLGADSMYWLHEVLGGPRVLLMQVTSAVLTLAGAVALVWRRRRPVLVAAVMTVLGVLSLALTGATNGFELGVALALYVVATTAPPRTLLAAAGASVLALLVGARVLPLARTVGAKSLGVDPDDADAFAAVTGSGPFGFATSPAWFAMAAPVVVLALLAVGLGTLVHARRQRVAALAEAARARAEEHAQRTRLAQASERAQIAREMHDVVAHSISVMVALGGGASAAFDWAPDRARAALDELVDTGRAALGDMRRILGVLHDDDGDGPAGDAPLEPQPGSLDLPRLVGRARTAGLAVRTSGLAVTGLDALDPALQLAVYRIVQESLTNTLRHAPVATDVEVDVRRRADAVEVVVTDRGGTAPATAGPGSRRGLVGMTERAAAFGGTVEAGPYGQGWRVRALLPWNEGDA